MIFILRYISNLLELHPRWSPLLKFDKLINWPNPPYFKLEPAQIKTMQAWLLAI